MDHEPSADVPRVASSPPVRVYRRMSARAQAVQGVRNRPESPERIIGTRRRANTKDVVIRSNNLCRENLTLHLETLPFGQPPGTGKSFSPIG